MRCAPRFSRASGLKEILPEDIAALSFNNIVEGSAGDTEKIGCSRHREPKRFYVVLSDNALRGAVDASLA
jgi:hypothetical protein